MEKSLLKHALSIGIDDNCTTNWAFWLAVCNPLSNESSVPLGDWVTKKQNKKCHPPMNYFVKVAKGNSMFISLHFILKRKTLVVYKNTFNVVFS